MTTDMTPIPEEGDCIEATKNGSPIVFGKNVDEIREKVGQLGLTLADVYMRDIGDHPIPMRSVTTDGMVF